MQNQSSHSRAMQIADSIIQQQFDWPDNVFSNQFAILTIPSIKGRYKLIDTEATPKNIPLTATDRENG